MPEHSGCVQIEGALPEAQWLVPWRIRIVIKPNIQQSAAYILNGEPVEVETQITVNFTLSGG